MSNFNTKNFRVTSFETVSNKNGKEIDLEDFFEDVRTGNSCKQLIDSIRSSTDKIEQTNLKKELFNIIVSGCFKDAKDESIISHSGLIAIDLDNLADAKRTKEYLIKHFPHLFAAFISASGKGVKAFVKIPNEPILHTEYFKAIEKHFKDTFQIEIDSSGKNLARKVYTSYDADLYVNYESPVFEKLLIKIKSGSAKDYNKRLIKFRSLMESIPAKIVDNGKHLEYRNLICAVNTELGEEEARIFGEKVLFHSSMLSILDEILSHATKTDKPLEVLTHLANQLRPPKVLIGVSKDFISNYDHFKNWFSGKYKLKRNIVKDIVYYQSINDSEPRQVADNDEPEWKHLDDLIINNFLLELDSDKIRANRKHLETIIYSDYSSPYDPLKDYFNKVEGKLTDKSDSEIAKFFEIISGKSVLELSDLFEACKTWFASAAGMAIGEAKKIRTLYCLGFFSKSGFGKTSIFKGIVPKELEEYQKENFNDYETKDAKLDLVYNFLILVDELGESGKHDLKKLKSLITQTTVKERPAYARRPVDMVRRASFITTFDKLKVYDDSAGNRRFITIPIQEIDWNEFGKIDLDTLWGQALHLYKTNAYSKKIDRFLLKHNERFEKVCVEMELLQSMLDFTNQGTCQKLTCSEILAILQNRSNLRNLKVQAVGESLGKLGYKSASTRIEGKNPRYCYTVCFKPYDSQSVGKPPITETQISQEEAEAQTPEPEV